jgi:catechol 2,3-dioxygenase-like lactoylglutathione lyase family enzyme
MVHHVGLTVSDLERSIAFYQTVLGCRVRERSENSGADVGEVTGIAGAAIIAADLELPGGGLLELLQYVAPVGERLAQRRNQGGHTHIGFLVEDVDAAYDRLVAYGVTPTSRPVRIDEPGSAWDGVRVFYARDPDGRTIECVGEREKKSPESRK